MAAAACVAASTSCGGAQSALAPAGLEADWLADLFWWMAIGSLAVWAATLLVAVYCARVPPEDDGQRRARLLIVGGGVIVPTVVLTGLLVYGLSLVPPLVARAPQGTLLVDVEGEMWWWRVRYHRGGAPIELANEIRLPVGERVQFRLSSDNVIHSFWIPPLGGKMDMIPGRITYLSLQPTRAGVFRGACAEYCGTSHARMNFVVEVMEAGAFARWLEQQASAAPPAIAGSDASAGAEVFLEAGCHACHRVRGTTAAGGIGPDLTHVGGRLSLAAGVLANDPANFERWLRGVDRVKPGAHMPAFDMLPPADLRALAAYLEGLQ